MYIYIYISTCIYKLCKLCCNQQPTIDDDDDEDDGNNGNDDDRDGDHGFSML